MCNKSLDNGHADPYTYADMIVTDSANAELNNNKNRMAAKQSLMQPNIQAAKEAIMAVKEAENPVNAARSVQIITRTGSPALKQLSFKWKAVHKYQELWNFEIEVNNIFVADSLNIARQQKGCNHTQLAW